MAFRPAIGQKYARLRQQQHALVSAAGLEDSDSETEEERGQLAAAAALANAVAEESSRSGKKKV
ncbi:unnamed protein product [Effrenium voratum]|nr:unnamed protein product [Effrenium voratum]